MEHGFSKEVLRSHLHTPMQKDVIIMRMPTPKQKPNGKWYIQLRPNGKSIYIDGWNREQVLAQAMAYKAGLQERRAGRVTFGEAMNDYIEQRKSVLSPATIRSYKARAHTIFPALYHKDIRSITQSMLQAAVNRAAAERSPKTVKNDWLFAHAVLKANGITIPNVRMPRLMPVEQPWFTPEQVLAFLDVIKGNPWETHWLLGLHSLRSAEIFGLQWEDIGEHGIYVHRTLLRVGDGTKALVEATKNPSSTRHIPYLIPRLKTLLEAARWHDSAVCHGSPSGCNRALHVACERGGLPIIGLHGLRRSFASLAYHLRLSERETMVIGGWSDHDTMHRYYIRLSNRDMQDAAQRFRAFFAQQDASDMDFLDYVDRVQSTKFTTSDVIPIERR